MYEKLKYFVKHYYTDDWEVYREVIPAEKLTQSKKYTIGIEQNNSNVRHYLGRMTRRTKVVTKSIEMLNISLLITCYLNEYNGYDFFKILFYLSLIEDTLFFIFFFKVVFFFKKKLYLCK